MAQKKKVKPEVDEPSQPSVPPPPPSALDRVKPANPGALAGIGALLVLAIWAVFWQTVNFDFVNLDDDQYVSESEDTQQGFTLQGIKWAWTNSQVGNWHPLTTMSFMLDWSLFGNNPAGYHLHNVLLHCVATVLLFLLMRRMTGALWLSAMATAVFALHPLRAESVAWITERKDVLSNVFFVLTLYAYVYYVARPSVLRYVLLLVMFALGLMSKAMLVTLPVLMLLLDYWPLGRLPPPEGSGGTGKFESWKAFFRRAFWLVLEKAPLFIVAAVFAAVTAHLSLSAERSVAVLPLATRLKMAPISCVIYLGQMFWPVGLAAHYPYTEAGPPLWQALAACGVLVAISAVVLVLWKKFPYLIVGWLWYIVTLLPVIGLVPGGNQLRADRYTGLTQIGLYMALLWLVAELSARWPQRRIVGAAAGIALVIAMMVATWIQTGYWKDSEILWRRALAVTTDNAIAHEHLAGALGKQAERLFVASSADELKRAEALMLESKKHYERAIEIEPKSLPSLCNLANIYSQDGKFVEADRYYQQALAANPRVPAVYYNMGVNEIRLGRTANAMASFRKALEFEPRLVPAHNNLANLLREQGKIPEAIRHYEEAIAIKPDFSDAYSGLGMALAQQGKFDEAVKSFKKVQEIDPQNTAGLANLAMLAKEQGQFDDAEKYFRQAVEIQPRDVIMLNNLGDLLSRQKKVDEAIVVYEKAAELAPKSALVRYNLAFCYEQKGRAADALASYQKAWLLAIANHDAAVERILKDRFGSLRFLAP